MATAPQQVISSVGAHHAPRSGHARLLLKDFGAAAHGWQAGRFGVTNAGRRTATILFNFDRTRLWDGRLDFSPEARPVITRSAEAARFGTASVRNLTQAAWPQGWRTRIGRVTLSRTATTLALDFTLAAGANRPAINLAFGGAAVLAAKPLQATRCGSVTLAVTDTIAPKAITAQVSQPRVSPDQGGRALILDLAAQREAGGLPLHLPFGDGRPMVAQGSTGTHFGNARAENAALGIRATLAKVTTLGRAWLRAHTADDGMPLYLQFAKDIPANNLGAGLQFAFWGVRSLRPYGIHDVTFGNAALVNVDREVYPQGFRHGWQWGTASLRLRYPQTTRVWPFKATRFGDFKTVQDGTFPVAARGVRFFASREWHRVENLNTYTNTDSDRAMVRFGKSAIAELLPQVAAPDAIGYPPGDTGYDWMWDGDKWVLIHNRKWGEALVSHEIRRLPTYSATAMTHFGQPWIVPQDRYLQGRWFVVVNWGNTLVGLFHDVEPEPLHTPHFGTANVEFEDTLHVQGERHRYFGLPWLSRDPRIIDAISIRLPEFGEYTRAKRDRDYLAVEAFKFDLHGTQFGERLFVELGDKTVKPYGWLAARQRPLTHLTHGGRALPLTGIAAPQITPEHMVSHQHRTLEAVGRRLTRFPITSTTIYNAARQLVAQPVKGRFGEHRVFDPRQDAGATQLYATSVGTHRISFFIQRSTVFNPYHFTRSGHTTRVEYLNRPVAPESMRYELGRVPIVEGRAIPQLLPLTIPPRNLISPQHEVKNQIPQIYPHSFSRWHVPALGKVELFERYLVPEPMYAFAHKKPHVGFLDRIVLAKGRRMTAFQIQHDVRNKLAAGLGDRTIEPESFLSSDYKIPYPTVRSLSIWHPREPLPRHNFGNARVWLNRIIPYYSIVLLARHFPHPTVRLYRREVAAQSIPSSSAEPGRLLGKPRMSPYNVYCTNDYPDSYQRSDEGYTNWHPVGSENRPAGYANSWMVWWGHAAVDHFHRVIRPQGSLLVRWQWNAAEVKNVDVSIQAHPITPRPLRMPVLIPHDQTTHVEGRLHVVFGDTRAQRNLAQDGVHTESHPATRFGRPKLALKNRAVHADSLLVGSRFGNNNPMVHYPRRFPIGGGELVQWGKTWVSHSTRAVLAEGERLCKVARRTGYKRGMVVRLAVPDKNCSARGCNDGNHTPTGSNVGGVQVVGTPRLHMGKPQAMLAVQHVRPYMIPRKCLRCAVEGVRHV